MSATAPIPPSLAPDYAAAREICQRHARSFHFASHFLPSPKREHAYAIYAFCRQLDDAADELASATDVDRLAATIDIAYAGADAAPAGGPLRAFAHTVAVCEIPRQYFLDLAEGCRMDLGVARYDTWPQLERYCYHVAGVVGLIMCHVLGVRDEAARAHAISMGNAMQLTNILRDVREDLDRGRVYLPRQELEQFGVSQAELQTRRLTPAMSGFVQFQIGRARSLYHAGSRGIWAIPNDGSRLTASVMAAVYSGILNVIEEHRYDVFAGRAKVSTVGKLARLPRALRLARCERGDEVPDVFS